MSEQNKLSLGFGFFSTVEDEDSWCTLAYDGLEGTKGQSNERACHIDERLVGSKVASKEKLRG